MDVTDGSGSRDEEREDDIMEPGAESLELKLVLLCGRSGADRLDADDDPTTGAMTPNGLLDDETDEAGEGTGAMELHGAERTLDRIVATVAVAWPMTGCVRVGFDPAHNSAVVGLVG